MFGFFTLYSITSPLNIFTKWYDLQDETLEGQGTTTPEGSSEK